MQWKKRSWAKGSDTGRDIWFEHKNCEQYTSRIPGGREGGQIQYIEVGQGRTRRGSAGRLFQ
eukprot:7914976-Karenia_brevis.AAC.1